MVEHHNRSQKPEALSQRSSAPKNAQGLSKTSKSTHLNPFVATHENIRDLNMSRSPPVYVDITWPNQPSFFQTFLPCGLGVATHKNIRDLNMG